MRKKQDVSLDEAIKLACDENKLRYDSNYRADKWVAENKITKEKIDYANRKAGCTELSEFAEYFNVTKEYMKRMLKIHYNIDYMD